MTYEEIKYKLQQCETALRSIENGTYQSFEGFNAEQTTSQLQSIKESLEGKLKVLAEQDVVEADDFESPEVDTPTAKSVKSLEKSNQIKDILTDALQETGNEVSHSSASTVKNLTQVEVTFKNDSSKKFNFIEKDGHLHYVTEDKKLIELGPIATTQSGEPELGDTEIKSSLIDQFRQDLSESKYADYLRAMDKYKELQYKVDRETLNRIKDDLTKAAKQHGIDLDLKGVVGEEGSIKTDNPDKAKELADDGADVELVDKLDEQTLKQFIEEAYLEVLAEETPIPSEPIGDVKVSPDTVLEDGTETLLEKFPALKVSLIKLLTKDFKQFIDTIEWVTPRPTTFRINTQNGQEFTLQWTGKNFEANILGKNYFLGRVDEFQLALEKLSRLFQEQPVNQQPEEEPAPADDLGGIAGGGGGDFPGGEGGAGAEFDAEGGEDAVFGDEGGEDLTDDNVSFEDEPVS